MGSKRRGSSRPATSRRARFQAIESLEARQLLASNIAPYLSPYIPSDLYIRNPATNMKEGAYLASSFYRAHDVNGVLVSNEGKIVTGVDRTGNQWTITVHGPGKVIVSDTTPNDGALDDDIDTIQIVGSDINRTYVTGSTTSSATTVTGGTVRFNRLIAAQGVNSVVLNGFDLTRDVTPAVTSETGVYLLGGARHLEFHDVIGLFDTSLDPVPTPYQIQIGQANIPTSVKTSIHLDSIYNSVYDGSGETIPTEPITVPWIQFSVNGVIQEFSIVSATQSAYPPNYVTGSQQGTVEAFGGWPISGPPPAGYQFYYNVVGTTGRTSLQAVAVNKLSVRGSARNFTAQRDTVPFTSSNSGLNRLNSAEFGGVADGVALDVNGPIRRLKLHRGLGDPTGVFTATAQTPTSEQNPEPRTIPLPATLYGIPQGSTGYPAAGLLGGAVRARSIGGLSANASNLSVIYSQSPAFVSLNHPNYPTPTSVPGMALTNSSITTDGSIGHANIEGNLLNSAIASGYDYQAHLQGLQAARRGTRIESYRQRGDLINSTVSASADLNPTNPVIRDGEITGNVAGKAYKTGGRNALGSFDSGVFARRKVGRLPVSPT
ncbi:hypothetical protein [Paludisphaera sp.]|uniref:hypothetical protein n=1 Tax=Paludisphaera sp. TaxID=2017432 RepID=UPI00301C4C7A